MAARFWVGTASANWNNNANWSATSGGASGASFPTNADDATFDANSNIAAFPNVTVNVASAAQSATFTTYTGTLTMSATLTLGSTGASGGSLTLGSGMTISGSSGIVTRAQTFSITSNGKVWPNSFGIGITSNGINNTTTTLNDNLEVGSLSLGSLNVSINGTANIITNGSLQVRVSVNGSINTTNVKIIFKGTGSWTHLNQSNLNMSIDIDTGANTLTIGSNASMGGSAFTYISGTVISSSQFNLGGSSTNNIVLDLNGDTSPSATTTSSTGVNFSTLEISGGGSRTWTLNSPLAIIGTTVFGGTFGLSSSIVVHTINGSNVYMNGSMAILCRRTAGTSTLILQGTGTWSDAIAETTNSTGILNDLQINTTGTITIPGKVSKSSGTLTYTAGTVTTTGSTLLLEGACTIDAAAITWNNLRVLNTITAPAAITITFVGNHTFNGTLIINQTGFAATLNGGDLLISGNISFPLLTVGNITGTSTIRSTGAGTLSMNASVTTGTLRSNLVFQNAANTFVISGTIQYQTGTITYTSGTIDTTGSTLVLMNTATLATAGMSWNNFNISTGFVINSTLSIGGTLTIAALAANITLSGAAGFSAATVTVAEPTASRTITLQTLITYDVTGSITVSASSSNRITIASSSGTTRTLLNIPPGATMDLSFVSGTRVDSSSGQTVYTRKGVLTNTVNWSLLLPPDTVSKSFILE